MSEPDMPQTYLITPEQILPGFDEVLAQVLDAQPVACIRLDVASRDEDVICRAADALRDVAHRADVALVLAGSAELAQRLGLDGVHLGVDASVRTARKTLGTDAIVGMYAGTSRHDGLSGGEAGADYIAFNAQADVDLFAWWSQTIELPIVAEGALTPERVTELAPVTDFFALGAQIWSADDPAAALVALMAHAR